VTFPRTPMANQ